MVQRKGFLVCVVAVLGIWSTACGTQPTSVAVSPSQARLTAAGEQAALTATVLGKGGSLVVGLPVEWKSSAPEVATVEDGTVTAVAGGTATITASVRGVSGTAEVSVSLPAALDVQPLELALAPGAAGMLTAMVRDQAGAAVEGVVVAFASDNPEVATVDAAGQVTAVAAGEATVSAMAGEFVVQVTVRVAAPPGGGAN